MRIRVKKAIKENIVVTQIIKAKIVPSAFNIFAAARSSRSITSEPRGRI
jgi:hypothetical protein